MDFDFISTQMKKAESTFIFNNIIVMQRSGWIHWSLPAMMAFLSMIFLRSKDW
jgi:hypothetical protein